MVRVESQKGTSCHPGSFNGFEALKSDTPRVAIILVFEAFACRLLFLLVEAPKLLLTRAACKPVGVVFNPAFTDNCTCAQSTVLGESLVAHFLHFGRDPFGAVPLTWLGSAVSRFRV